MPFYTYRAKDPGKSCSKCLESLEAFQKMSEPALEVCTECGSPVSRLFHATPTIRDDSTKTILSDDNIRKHGFKKLVNRGGGKYDEVV